MPKISLRKISFALFGILLLFRIGVAQPNAAEVTILAVDDSAYPQLELYISLTDSQRLSVIPGLTSANFFADTDTGQPMEVVEAVQERRPLRVVVVMDITGSVSRGELDNQRAAVTEMLKFLTPTDQLGIVVMDEASTDVFLPLQTGSEQITTRMAALRIRVDVTGNVFWDGVYSALNVLGTPSIEERHVVIVMSDVSPSGGDGIRSQDEVLTLALENQVEIYGLYFEYEGDGIPQDPPELPPELTILSEGTGGFSQGVAADFIQRSEDYTDDQALVPMMQNVMGVLQSQYRVRLTSPIPEDGLEHPFTVRVEVDGSLTPPITGAFQAGTSSILLTFPDVTANQNITLPATIAFLAQPREGQISRVTAQAITSSGEEIELPLTGEYAVTLERGQFAPGALTLQIQAEDTIGNSQVIALPLNILDSLFVELTNPPVETIQTGETVTLDATIGFAASVQQVEFLVNGELVETKNTSPLDLVSFTWKAPAAGRYTLEIVAQDIQGQRVSAQANIEVTGTGGKGSSGLSTGFLVLLGLVFVVGIGISGAGIWLVLRRKSAPKMLPPHSQSPVVNAAPIIPADVPPPIVSSRHPVNAALEGPNGEQWRLNEGQNTIGRHSNNHIQVLDESVSRHHAVIEVMHGHYYYMDLPTASHPSEMNGDLLKPEQRYELQDGTLIRVGSSLLRFTVL